MTRYNINGEEIEYMVKCRNCGHEVDIQNIRFAELPGMEYINELIVCNEFANCCKEPDYEFLHECDCEE